MPDTAATGVLAPTLISYRLEGRGDPLLLLHGWGVTYSVWQELISLLAPHYQLILVELPGLRDSAPVPPDIPYYVFCAEQIEALRLALRIERWAILAYSTGTRACQAYIQHYPQHVTQAVFLCPLHVRWLPMLCILIGQPLNAAFPCLANWFVSGWRLTCWIRIIGFNGRGDAHISAWMRELEQHPLIYLKRMLLELPGRGRAPFTLPHAPQLSTLFIWGRHDVLVASPRHPRPHDVFLPTTHGAPLLAPQRVADVVLPFLQQQRLAAMPTKAQCH